MQEKDAELSRVYEVLGRLYAQFWSSSKQMSELQQRVAKEIAENSRLTKMVNELKT